MTNEPRKGPRNRGRDSRIAALRLAAGLTQQQLADIVGVKRLCVARWESGASVPNGKNLLSLADALGCEPSELF